MNRASPRHAAIVLAAGASQRLGITKQLIEIDGEPLVRRVMRAVLITKPSRTLVVLGKNADAIFSAVADLAVTRVDCVNWAEGMSASLRTGIAQLNDDCDGALITLCDQPALTTAHLQKLLGSWHEWPKQAIASAYANTLGVPAILPRSWFAEINALRGDQGARDLLRNRTHPVVAVSAPELERDIDHPQDLL